jgi:hypothetical protein
VVIAFAAQLHKHFGIPRQPQRLIASVEFHRAIVNAKVVAEVSR